MKHRYVLTERGKLLVAMLIVLFLLLPSVILVIYTTMRDRTPDDSYDNGGIHQNGNNPASSSGGDEQNALDSSLAGPIAFDLEAGTMSFIFTPDLQVALDVFTIATIGDLLTSPQNTTGSKVAVEIPQMADEKTAILTNAVVHAFSIHDVPLTDVVFFVYQQETDTRTVKVNISFS